MLILTEKKYVNPFEIDESNIESAAPEFVLVDSDQDDDGQDKTDILTEYYFAF